MLNDLEHMIGELRIGLKEGRPVSSLLQAMHDAVRGLRTEMDRSADSPWNRQLAAIRSAVSNLLTAEMETTTGRMRRLLRPRPANEIVAGSLVDARDVHDADAWVELVGACRHYAGELAVGEVPMRSHSELAQYVETGTKIVLDALRQAGMRSARSANRSSTPRSVFAAASWVRNMPGCWPRRSMWRYRVPGRNAGRSAPENPPLVTAVEVADRRCGYMPAVRNCRAGIPIAAAFAP